MAAAALISGRRDLVDGFLQGDPGWAAEGGTNLRLRKDGTWDRSAKTRVKITRDRDGRQSVRVPECPKCGRGRNLPPLLLDRLEQCGRGVIDISDPTA